MRGQNESKRQRSEIKANERGTVKHCDRHAPSTSTRKKKNRLQKKEEGHREAGRETSLSRSAQCARSKIRHSSTGQGNENGIDSPPWHKKKEH